MMNDITDNSGVMETAVRLLSNKKIKCMYVCIYSTCMSLITSGAATLICIDDQYVISLENVDQCFPKPKVIFLNVLFSLQ